MLREHGRGLRRLLSVGLRPDEKEEEAGDFGRRAEGQERGSSSPVAENFMTKIVLSASRDIPLNKLVLSQANVRRIKAGVSVEELAEDIARRGLLQSLSVRPVLDGQGQETGRFEVPAGGRRFQALQLLVKQKRLAKTAPVPCLVKTDGIAEEDSLAENTMREALHPLDQFRAFQALRNEHGLGDEEIAAKFFVTPAVVRQRLKLVAVSPKLLHLYAENAMSLDQLMGSRSRTTMPVRNRCGRAWPEATALVEAFAGRALALAVEPRGSGQETAHAAVILTGKGRWMSPDAKTLGRVEQTLAAALRDAGSALVAFRLVATGHALEGVQTQLRAVASRGRHGLTTEEGRAVDASPEAERALAKAMARDLHSRKSRDVLHIVCSARAGTDRARFAAAVATMMGREFAGHRYLLGRHDDKG